MLKEYITRIKKAHPAMVSFFLKKYNVADDGTPRSVYEAYRKYGNVFLREWYDYFHMTENSIEGDSWWNKFQQWFSNSSDEMNEVIKVANDANTKLENNSNSLTESEIYEKQERQIWILFLGMGVLILLLLFIFFLIKRRS